MKFTNMWISKKKCRWNYMQNGALRIRKKKNVDEIIKIVLLIINLN